MSQHVSLFRTEENGILHIVGKFPRSLCGVHLDKIPAWHTWPAFEGAEFPKDLKRLSVCGECLAAYKTSDLQPLGECGEPRQHETPSALVSIVDMVLLAPHGKPHALDFSLSWDAWWRLLDQQGTLRGHKPYDMGNNIGAVFVQTCKTIILEGTHAERKRFVERAQNRPHPRRRERKPVVIECEDPL